MITIKLNKKETNDLSLILGALSERLENEKDFGEYGGPLPYRTMMNKIRIIANKLKEAKNYENKN